MYENPPKPSAPPAEDVLEHANYALEFGHMVCNILTAAGKLCLYAIIAACVITFLFLNVFVGMTLITNVCAGCQRVTEWDESIVIEDMTLGTVRLDGNVLSELFERILVSLANVWYNDLNGMDVCKSSLHLLNFMPRRNIK